MVERPPKSPVVSRVRYVTQWLWFPVLGVLWLVPYVIVLCLYFALLPFCTVWDLDAPGPPGSGRRFRWRRRMWLDRKRRQREVSADLPWLEDQLKALFDGRAPILLGRQSSGTLWRYRDGRVEIHDSYFRQLGVVRALHVAREYGYVPSTDGMKDLPWWLVLRRANDGQSSSGGIPPHGTGRQPYPIATPDQGYGYPAPTAQPPQHPNPYAQQPPYQGQ